MRFLTLAAAVALPCAALAQSSETFKLRGWTADGFHFVYEDWIAIAPHPDAMQEVMDARVALVVDARTGVETRYALEVIRSEDEPPELKKALDAVNVQDKEFDAWQRANPTRCRFGRTSPDGAATAEVTSTLKALKGKWKGDAFVYGFEGEDSTAVDFGSANLKLAVSRGGASWPSRTYSPRAGFAGQAPAGTVRACWSPTGKRVAWILHSTLKTMRDAPFTTFVIGPAGGPRIELRAHKSVLDKLLAPVAAALEQAGFVPTASRQADEARPKSIVYTTAQAAEMAAKVALAVPGGATVEPITWKSPSADIIVAIGASVPASGK